MDESLSWRARFAKSNINILNITLLNTPDGLVYRWFIEFTYHPKPGTFKWCKTYVDVVSEKDYFSTANLEWVYKDISTDDMAQTILDKVLELRKELED